MGELSTILLALQIVKIFMKLTGGRGGHKKRQANFESKFEVRLLSSKNYNTTQVIIDHQRSLLLRSNKSHLAWDY